MDRHVPGALVTGFESLIPGIRLPDTDDRHVVTAAVKTRAEAIVTFNLKDFPEQALAPFGVRAIHPDDVRHGTVSILAGIDLHSNHVFGRVEDRHRSCEFIALLRSIDGYYPSEAIIRVVLDNHSPHIS